MSTPDDVATVSRPAQNRPRRPASRATRWCRVAAAVLVVLSGVQFVTWGNRWYLTEMVARSTAENPAESLQWRYDLLETAHQALIQGLALLLLAGVFGFIAARRS